LRIIGIYSGSNLSLRCRTDNTIFDGRLVRPTSKGLSAGSSNAARHKRLGFGPGLISLKPEAAAAQRPTAALEVERVGAMALYAPEKVDYHTYVDYSFVPGFCGPGRGPGLRPILAKILAFTWASYTCHFSSVNSSYGSPDRNPIGMLKPPAMCLPPP